MELSSELSDLDGIPQFYADDRFVLTINDDGVFVGVHCIECIESSADPNVTKLGMPLFDYRGYK